SSRRWACVASRSSTLPSLRQCSQTRTVPSRDSVNTFTPPVCPPQTVQGQWKCCLTALNWVLISSPIVPPDEILTARIVISAPVELDPHLAHSLADPLPRHDPPA